MLDIYTLKARAWPAFMAGLPAAAVLGVAFPGLEWWHAGLLSTGVAVALAFLLAQMARSAGKAKEPRLFKMWDGKPTIRYLRHRHSPLDGNTLTRYHRNIERLSPDLRMPPSNEEHNDHASADGVYEAACRMLIGKTRDRKRFRLLFEENVQYGFCRNLWALKPFAIGIALLSATVCGFLIFHAHATHGEYPIPAIIVGALCAVCVLLWSTWFTAAWVKISSDAYAERLLEASDDLVNDSR